MFYKVPINTKKIRQLLPHRSPMVWVDNILLMNGDGSGTTETIIKEDSLALHNDVLIETAFIEIIGQSFGYLKALDLLKKGYRLKVVYLASIDDYKLESKRKIRFGDKITSFVKLLNIVGSIAIIEGEVFHGKEKLCYARVKCYAEYQKRFLYFF